MSSPHKKTYLTLTSLILILVIVIAFVASWGYYRKSQVKPAASSSVPAASVRTEETPEEAASTFYTWYTICLNEHFKHPHGTIDQDCPYQNSSHISQKIVSPNLNILCAQNVPAKINVSQANVSGNKAVLTIRTIYDNDQGDISLELTKSDKTWQISQISCPNLNTNNDNTTTQSATLQ